MRPPATTSDDAATVDGGLDSAVDRASPDFGGARHGAPGRGAPQRLDWNAAYRRNAPLGDAQYVAPFMPSIIGSATPPMVGRRVMRQPAAGHVAAVSLEEAAVDFLPAAVSHVSSSRRRPHFNDRSASLAF